MEARWREHVPPPALTTPYGGCMPGFLRRKPGDDAVCIKPAQLILVKVCFLRSSKLFDGARFEL